MILKHHQMILPGGIIIAIALVLTNVSRPTASASVPFPYETTPFNAYLPYVAKQFPLISKVSWWPYGTCYDVAYDAITGLLLIGSGEVLELLNVADPAHPYKVNEIFLEGLHQHIVLSGGIAYITTYRRDGLQIIDVSNPANLRTIAFYPIEGNPHGIEILGANAYVAADQHLDIVDVSNPGAPRLRSHFQVTGRAAHTYISNDRLYLTVWQEGVYVLDISNPDSPTQTGFHASPDVSLLAVIGNLALLTKWYDPTMQIFDVSVDSAFDQISTLELLDETHNPMGVVVDIAFSNSMAFVSGEYWDHLQTIDLSDPTNPVIAGSMNAADSGFNLKHYYSGGGPIILVGDLIYQSAWTDGIGIFDVSNPRAIRGVGNYDTPDPYRDVSIAGHIACIANQIDGLRLLDVSDPLNIKGLGVLYTRGTFLQVICTEAQYAYAVTEGWGLQIFDISKPDAPQLIGSVDTPGIARGIALANGYAYVADSEGGLRVIDVHVPSTPFEAGFLLFPASTTRVAVSGGYAFVGTEAGYLQIVNVSNPANPVIEESFQFPGAASSLSSLTVLNNDLYVGTNSSYLYRLDISDPAAPHLKSALAIPSSGGPLEDIAISGEHAYISSLTFGLRVVDVTNPDTMTEIGSYLASGYGRGIEVAGNYIYYACDDAGLLILKDATK